MQVLDALWTMLRMAIVLAGTIYLMLQVRRPSKWIGRPFVWLMNNSHSKLSDWGLRHAKIDRNFIVLDVGCGGGRTIRKLAALVSEGKVYGVDYAEGSVAMSRSENAESIQAGRVKVKQASVSQLPFADHKFDLVTAIETQYYWPDLANDMQEVLRVLKPGGTLLIIAETYKNGAGNKILGPVMKLLGSSSLSVDDQRNLFSTAGYSEVEVFEERRKGWICAKGKKPEVAVTNADWQA
jgi:ubiquinone/menaquinone biosynthesis C-methylase UbiE